MAKLMRIRRDDSCAGCGVGLLAGTEAYWLPSERIVKCTSCHDLDQVHQEASATPASPTAPSHGADSVAPPASDVAGDSAQREYEKRSARELAKKQKRVADDAAWREAIKEQRPVLGRIAAAFTPRPEIGPESQATAAWKTGAEGERRVAEVLADAEGVVVLHDRRVPGSKANIDHIVVGPAGVFVIDAKKYRGGVEVRDLGGLFRTDERLYVNGRDRTKLVDGVLWQVEVVRAALADDFSDVAVHGVLCFIGCQWGLIMRRKRVKGVTALWPTALSDFVAKSGDLGERLGPVALRLRERLAPAR